MKLSMSFCAWGILGVGSTKMILETFGVRKRNHNEAPRNASMDAGQLST